MSGTPDDTPNRQAIDQPGAVRPGETLDTERLQTFLRAQLPDASGSLQIEQFPSGFSNLTYLLRLGERELVLRRPPFGANIKSGHDMSREYRILSALYSSYPKVPRPLLYSDDLSIIGAPFYVMERVNGVILRTRLPQGLTIEPELMRHICYALIDTLVELHSLDYNAAGLGDLGKPEGYVERQVGGWARRYANARTDDVPAMEQAVAWLQAHIPPTSEATLIHNDYKYDNMVLDPADLTRIKAILDWEMATLGDPLTDVGTTLAYWAEPDDPPALKQFGITTLPGNLDRQQWVERYAAQSGRDVSRILFYYVYGLFKNGVIVQQIYYRYRQGHTRDERFANLIELVRLYGEMTTRAIEGQRIHHLFAAR
ncbi:MAG TPA: phosphotransferase family protein [Herpetosiphonaceae bacterium]